MNKSVASLALLVASMTAQAYPMPRPGSENEPRPVPKTYCMSIYETSDGSQRLGSCDNSINNDLARLELKDNKCAEGQAAFTSVDVKIKSCPSFAQL